MKGSLPILTMSEASAFLELGLLRSAELPRVAMEALAQGLDSPALRRLAGELKPTASECEPQFRQALSQLSIPLPTREAARLIVARYYAMQIVNGLISPYRGACHIWWGPA